MEKLTVIIPGYNVEGYIEECILSVLDQTYQGIKVIYVDDGSTDSTRDRVVAITEKYPERHIKIVDLPNTGVSVARNTAIKLVDTEYMAFLDGDDTIPKKAYEQLIASLESNDASMVIGTVDRFKTGKYYRSYIHKLAIENIKERVSINDAPSLVYDTTSWNKIYKTCFIVENNIDFPEGYLYEDIPFTMHAHLAANHINIISPRVYNWRVREGNNVSLTQDRSGVKNFTDRFDMLGQAFDLITKYNGNNALRDALVHKSLSNDLPIFFDQLAIESKEYIDMFIKYTRQFFEKYHINAAAVPELTLFKKNVYQLLLHGDAKEIKMFMLTHSPKTDKYIFNNKQLVIENNVNNMPLESKQLCGNINVLEMLENDSILTVKTQFTSNELDMENDVPSYKVMAIHPETGTEIPLETEVVESKGAKKQFNFIVDLAGEQWKIPGYWKFKCYVTVNDATFELMVANPVRQVKARTLKYDSFAVDLLFDYNWQLKVNVIDEYIEFSPFEFDNDMVKIPYQYVGDNKLTSAAFILNDTFDKDIKMNQLEAVVTGDEINIDISNFEESVSGKLLFYVNSESEPTELKVFNSKFKVISNSLTTSKLISTENDWLGLTIQDALTDVIEVTISKANVVEIKINTENYQSQGYQLAGAIVKNKKTKEEYKISVIKNQEGLSLLQVPFVNDKNEVITPSGFYTIRLVYQDDVLNEKNSQLNMSEIEPVVFKLPERSKVRFYTDAHKKLSFNITQKPRWIDNSKLKRGLSYSVLYPLMRLLPINKKKVVFDSYWASKFSCNPRAIYEYIEANYPDMTSIWILKDTKIDIPGRNKKVNQFRFAYWWHVATAKYFVENTNLPQQYAKRKGQIEVQTLHGTFMKTMGFDEPYFKNGSEGRRQNFKTRISRWDFLISPSPYMTKVSTEAFNYEGQVLEVGTPRNDVLYTNNNPKYIAKVKEELAIPAGKKVILYAPTYRNKAGFDLALDIEKMKASLGDEYVLLLRLHYFVADKIADVSDDFVINASHYPLIEDLYLVSDVLMTDYSSVMFDYGHLQKPMLFFAYDYNLYVNDTRGVYLDYKETVPGPVVETTDEIIEQLADFDTLTQNVQKGLAEFYQEFCTFGRGDSAKAVVEAMLSAEVTQLPSVALIRNKIKRKLKYDKWYDKALLFIGKLPRKKIIVFESFFGRAYSDNPRALYEYAIKAYPEYKLVWNVNVEYQDYFIKNNIPFIKRKSFSGLWTLARAEYWVTNTRLWIPKPDKTKWVQTWHGTPLERLGMDISNIAMPGKTTKGYQRAILKDSSKWNYLISPNQYSSDIFETAFSVEKDRMLETGYPRNDRLYQYIENDAVKIKEKLGIPEDKKVILYAPTWRDDKIISDNKYKGEVKLDLDQLRNEISKDAVVLLRMHYLISNSLDLPPDDKDIIDVSSYPDINDLYIISDMLITDYSSVFYDYANLRRPIIFYAYDKDDYMTSTRGSYVDYESEVPGPILETSSEVIKQIKQYLLDPTLPENYPAFVEKYCSLEDGNASKRVWESIIK